MCIRDSCKDWIETSGGFYAFAITEEAAEVIYKLINKLWDDLNKEKAK